MGILRKTTFLILGVMLLVAVEGGILSHDDEAKGNQESSESWADWAKEKLSEGLGFKGEEAVKRASDYAADTAHSTNDIVTGAGEYSAQDKAKEGVEKGGEETTYAQHKAKEGKETAEQIAEEAKEAAEHKAKEMKDDMKQQVGHKTEDAKEAAKCASDKVGQSTEEAKEAADEHLGWAKDKAKQGYEAAKDTIGHKYEAAKQRTKDVTNDVVRGGGVRDEDL